MTLQVIHAAVIGDRQAVINGSKKLGFLTGYESKVGWVMHYSCMNMYMYICMCSVITLHNTFNLQLLNILIGLCTRKCVQPNFQLYLVTQDVG